jgi:DNA polymerase-3 subunit delta'
MNSFLIVSKDEEKIEEKIEEITKTNSAIKSNFSLKKINDARELKQLNKLSHNQKLVIIIRNIEEASIPALNAILKNIEEPNQNIIFILTTKNIKSVLPTVVSRCQIIKLKSEEKIDTKIASKHLEFLNLKKGSQLLFINKIQKREEALKFLKELILTCQENMHQKENREKITNCLMHAHQAILAIKANGNVKLQLTRMVINL